MRLFIDQLDNLGETDYAIGMQFRETLWLWGDEQLKEMLERAVAYHTENITDAELVPSCRMADAMRADLETELAKRGATWVLRPDGTFDRSEEHTSELQPHSFISYA